jgi:probable rRNA maturation factor
VKVTVFDRQKDLSILKRPLRKFVEVVLSLYKQKADEVIIHFVTAKRIQALHQQFFNDPSLTDCISFPIDPGALQPHIILGEIFICPFTALQYSSKHQIDPYQELSLYIIHGLLHCIGYDDIDPRDRKKMRLAEKKALVKLSNDKVYLDPYHNSLSPLLNVDNSTSYPTMAISSKPLEQEL